MITATNAKIEYVTVHGNKYILAHEMQTKKNATFQGAVMDEQFFIFRERDNEEDTQLDYDFYVDGFDNTYAENTIFFVPNKYLKAAQNKIKQILNEWKSEGKHFLDFDEGVYYIAYKYTKSGMWVFMNENNGQDTFFESYKVFDDIATVVGVADTDIVCNNTTLYVTGTPEESSGSDFYNSLLREKDPIVALMMAEGFTFEDVEEPEEEDDE
jgi:hypothetical protein